MGDPIALAEYLPERMMLVSEQVLCDRCGRPIHDTAYVCSVCADRLARDLASVVAVAGEAWTTIARQSRLATNGRGTDRPLPFSWEAADATWAASNTLTTWARHIAETRGIPGPTPAGPVHGPVCRCQPCHHVSCALIASRSGEHPLAAVASWLGQREQLTWLRHRREAPDAFDELHDACRLAVRTVDLPPVRWYAGKCDNCDTDLYAAPSAKTVRCRDCSTEHDADARRAWLLDLAEDQLAHASLAAAAITALGLRCKDATVRKWAERGRLTSHGADHRGRPLYRVGDVRLLAVEAERRAETRNLTLA